MSGDVVVWGNCQAAPIADLLRPVLQRYGLQVVTVPPVYLATRDELARVHDTVSRCALLLSQPVSDAYRFAGCSTASLAGLLPPGGRLITFPVLYSTAPFPFMTHGYDGAGERIDAPLTDYHDLRVLQAAAAGRTAAQALAAWPPPNAEQVRSAADAARIELRRREQVLDVALSDLLDRAPAWWTMTHPDNGTLAAVADRLLRAIGVEGSVTLPQREYLGQRRAPVDAAVYEAWGLTAEPDRAHWVVDGLLLPLAELLDTQLRWYAAHPDVVTATLTHRSGEATGRSG